MSSDDSQLASGRHWATLSIASFGDVPDILPVPYRAFVLLLAADARSATDEALLEPCRRLLRAGARVVAVWGADSLRVHNAFDQAAEELRLNEGERVVMTSWHDNEPLEEATWYAAVAAFPDEAYEDAAEALVAISIGSLEWESQMRGYLQAGAPLKDEA